MLCGKCNNPVPDDGDYVECKGCKSFYHFKQCSGLSRSTYTAKSALNKSQWRCVQCREKVSEKPSEIAVEEEESTIQTVLKLVRDLRDEIQELRSELSVLKNLHQTVSVCEQEIIKLREEGVAKDKVIEELTSQVNDIDQYGRNRNLEISNLVVTKDENLNNIAIDIAKKLDVELSASDIDVVHRLPTKNIAYPPKVVIQFVTRKKRDEILAARKKATIKNSDLVKGVAKEHNLVIYINEHLSSFFRSLLWLTKQKAKSVDFKFVWFRRSCVFARKNAETSEIVKIRCLKDIDKLK